MKILAIDPSLNSTGFAYRDPISGQVRHGVINPKPRMSIHRLNYVSERFDDILDIVRPELVAIEGYAMGVRGKTNNTFNLGEVGGMFRLLAYQSGAAIILVPPKTLKKFVTGNGNSDKDAMMQQVKANWGNNVKTDDEADAISLLHLGMCYLDRKLRRQYEHYSAVEGKIEYIKARL